MRVTARAPVRVDFAGAWTDVPAFSDPFGGATLNAAITYYVEGSLRATEEEGQATGEGAGLALHYESRIPAGSGLGTSATLNVVWLALVRREPPASYEDRMHIAELAFDIERVLGIVGGRQDQYASAVGGINLFEFGPDGVQRQAVNMPPAALEALQRQMVVIYTGKPRLSSNIHRHVWENFRRGNRETVDALFTLRNSAYQGKEFMEKWDPEQFGKLLTLQFESAKQLHPSTSNAEMEALFADAAPLIWGGKPCGAGGGGCVLFLARDDRCREQLARALTQRGLPPLDCRVDFEGLKLELCAETP